MSCSSIVKLLHKSRSAKYLFRFKGSIFLFHSLTEKVMTIEKVSTSMERSWVTALSGVNANVLFTFIQHYIPWNIICYSQNRKFMQPSLSTNSFNYMTFLSGYIFGLWRRYSFIRASLIAISTFHFYSEVYSERPHPSRRVIKNCGTGGVSYLYAYYS